LELRVGIQLLDSLERDVRRRTKRWRPSLTAIAESRSMLSYWMTMSPSFPSDEFTHELWSP
jgi:hypothetical protein